MPREARFFESLIQAQWIGCLGAGALGGLSLYVYGFVGQVIVPLMLSLITILISWLGPQILHELMEINDQLAGRSRELHERLAQLHK